MKKMLILMVMILPFVLTSCSDDDDKVIDRTSLDGTVWAGKAYGKLVNITCTFYKTTYKIEISALGETESITGEYEYEYPTIWLEYEGEVEEVAIINDNKFTIMIDEDEKVTFELK